MLENRYTAIKGRCLKSLTSSDACLQSIALALLLCLALFLPGQALANKSDTGGQHIKAVNGPVTAANPMELDLVVGDPRGSVMDVVAKDFAERVEKYSQGRIKILIAYGGALGEDETFHFHKVQVDQQDMAMGGIGNLAPMIRPLGVVTLPYIFRNIKDVVRGTTGKAAELLNSYAKAGGLRILTWTYCGFRHLSNSKRPVAFFDDLQRLRIRVPQSMVMFETYRAFGAMPYAIQWNMTYKALEHDLVDAQCYDYAGFLSMKFHEVGQKYITELHHLFNLQPLVINEHLFAQLPSDLQQALVKAGQEAQDFSLRYQDEAGIKAKRELIMAGVHITSIGNESEWRDRARKIVWPQVAKRMGGKEKINEYLRASTLPEWK